MSDDEFRVPAPPDARHVQVLMAGSGQDIMLYGLPGYTKCGLCDETIGNIELDGKTAAEIQAFVNRQWYLHIPGKHPEEMPVLTPLGWYLAKYLTPKTPEPVVVDEMRLHVG